MYYHVAMSGQRFFYYGPFSFVTGAVVASGLGYEGDNKFEKIVGCYVFELETAWSVIDMIRLWNH